MTFHRQSARFSPLLLEESEYYMAECLATMVCVRIFNDNMPGTLRICTKSVFFEPEDVAYPIVRFPFIATSSLECNRALNAMTMTSSSYSLMKVGGMDVPYTFVKEKRDISVTFRLTYADVVKDHIHTYTQQMVALSRLSPKEARVFQEIFLEGIEKAHRFDLGLLQEPMSERVLVEMDAMMLSKMAKERGKFAVGEQGVYFQPLHDVNGGGGGERMEHHGIAAVLRRQSAQMDVGLEIILGDRVTSSRNERNRGADNRTAVAWFIIFRSTEDREAAFETLSSVLTDLSPVSSKMRVSRPILDTMHQGPHLESAMRAWQQGTISNFEYLMYCNVASGRSFNDLAQYPVFPWVIKDYISNDLDLSDAANYRDLSKPVGALNPTRLETFRTRYHDMAEDGHDGDAFLYGTHFSCPAYVLFWLVRRMPAHQLRLQGGKFDAPDRLFHSVSESFASVYNSTSDVKELIPEMYGTDASFLRNDRCLALGCRQNGTPVADVELPRWANGSPDEFLRVHRTALESDYVSSTLHRWIDLIFGVHQRSLDKDNVFRDITYGTTELCSMVVEDATELAKHQLEVEEFGTCPRQIFFAEHPPKKKAPTEKSTSADICSGGDPFYGLSGDIKVLMRKLCSCI